MSRTRSPLLIGAMLLIVGLGIGYVLGARKAAPPAGPVGSDIRSGRSGRPEPESSRSAVVPPEDEEEAKVTVDPTVPNLEVLVLGEDGTPAPRATVVCQRAGRGTVVIPWTRERPRISLEPGPWGLSARVGPGPDLESSTKGVRLRPDAAPPPLTLRLAPISGVRGRLRFAGKRAERWAQVGLVRVPEGVSPEAAIPGEALNAATVDRGGGHAFTIRASPGEYVLVVRLPGLGQILAWKAVRLTGSMVVEDVLVPEPDPSRCLLVQLDSPDASPVYAASFSAMKMVNGKRARTWHLQPVVLDDGRWRVRLPEEAIAPQDGVEWRLRIEAEGFPPEEAPFVPGTGDTIRVALVRAARLHVRIENYRESGLEGRIWVAADSVFVDGPFDADGHISLTPVRSGTRELRVYVAAGRGRLLPIATEEIEVHAGTTEVTVTLPELHSLLIRGSGLAEKRITLHLAGWKIPVRPDHVADREASFRRLPAGDYEIHWQDARGRKSVQAVTVPGQRDVTLEER
jgi:hypothetical protein